MDEAQVVENKRSHLQTLINAFESQADTFLGLDTPTDDVPIPSLLDYDEFDHPDDDNMVLHYCRNVRPMWVKFNSKDTKESELVFEVLSTKSDKGT